MALRDVTIRISANIAGFTAGMAKAAASARAFERELEKSAAKRQALNDLGTAAGKVGIVAAAGLGLAIKSAVDWETSWAGVTKTVDSSQISFTKLEGQLRQMARTMPATHQEIAAVAEAAGQLGVKGQDIAAFSKVMVELGETTNLSADEAATSIAQMANIMQTAPEDIDNLSATLVALGNNGASTERDIIQLSQNMAGAGKIAGLTEGEVLAMANALASVGIDAEAGGSSVSRILMSMSKSIKTGSADLGVLAKTAGMTSKEFSTSFETSPARAFDAFTKGLARINKEGGDVFTLMDTLGFQDIRVTKALLAMATSGNLLGDSLKLQGQAWKDNTALTNEYEKRQQTAAAQTQIAWNNIKDASIDIGAVALPIVKDFAGEVAGMANAFRELPDPVQSATVKALALTAALGLGTLAVTKSITSYAALKASLDTLGLGMGTAAGKALLMRGGMFAIGASLLTFQGDLEKTDAGLGTFAQTLGAAALGFSVGGPVGAALATGGTLLYQVYKASTQASEAQKKLADSAKQAAQSFLDENGALAENARQLAAKQIGASGFRDARNAGVDAGTVVKATLGNTDAQQDVERQSNDYIAALKKRQQDAQRVLASAPLFSPEAEKASATFDETAAAISRATAAQDRLLNKTGTYGAATRKQRQEINQQNIAVYQSMDAFGRVAYVVGRAVGGLGQYSGAVAKIPKRVQTQITEKGSQASRSAIAALARAYNTTPRRVATALLANDLASGKLKYVKGQLVDLNGQPVDIPVDADVDAAVASAGQAKAALDDVSKKRPAAKVDVKDAATPKLRGIYQWHLTLNKTATTSSHTVTTYRKTVALPATGGAIERFAEGGFPRSAAQGSVSGPGTDTSDSIPAMLSNGEHVMTASDVRKAGGQGAMYRLRAGIQRGELRFASGGAVHTVLKGARALEEAQLRADISSASKELSNKTAGERLTGWQRKVAELELAEKKAALKRLLAGGSASGSSPAQMIEEARQAIIDARNAPVSLFDGASDSPWMNGGGFASRALQKATQIRTLAAKVVQLRKLGLNGALIGEIYGLGSAQGIAAADELLRGGSSSIRDLNSAYSSIQASNGIAAVASSQAPVIPGVKISFGELKLDSKTWKASMEVVARDTAGHLLDRQYFESKVY